MSLEPAWMSGAIPVWEPVTQGVERGVGNRAGAVRAEASLAVPSARRRAAVRTQTLRPCLPPGLPRVPCHVHSGPIPSRSERPP